MSTLLLALLIVAGFTAAVVAALLVFADPWIAAGVDRDWRGRANRSKYHGFRLAIYDRRRNK